MLAPEKPASRTFQSIVDTLKNPEPIVIAERFCFHIRNQSTDESISNYIAELYQLSQFCKFGAGLSDALCDQLVCGMLCKSVQKRLSEEDLTLENAPSFAVSIERAAKDSIEIQKKECGQ